MPHPPPWQDDPPGHAVPYPPPPGYPPYGGYPGWNTAPAPPRPRRPYHLSGLCIALTALLSITGMLCMLAVAAFTNRAMLLDRSFTDEEGRHADDFVGVTMGLSTVVMAASAVLWIIWQYQYAVNAQLCAHPGRSDPARSGWPGPSPRPDAVFGPGWAVSGWFIPVVNLALPLAQMIGSARVSDPDATARRRGRAPSVLALWWATFTTAFLTMVVGVVISGGDDIAGTRTLADAHDLRRGDLVCAGASGVAAVAALLGIVTLHELGSRQERALAPHRPRHPIPVVSRHFTHRRPGPR